jgi:hypothetical protein
MGQTIERGIGKIKSLHGSICAAYMKRWKTDGKDARKGKLDVKQKDRDYENTEA